MSNNNDETIKYIADMLQLQGDEEMALELEEAWAKMKHELVRIKGIAGRRLDRIAVLQHDKLILEDKLKDARARLDDLEVEASLARIRELDELGREPRSHIDSELEDHGGLWGAHCRGEI